MRVTGLGDGAALSAVAAGMITRDQSTVAHQLARTLKTRQTAELAHDRCGRHLRHAAQRLQSFDDCTDLRAGLAHGLVDGLFQLYDLRGGVVYFLQVMGQCGFQRGLLKAHVGLDPLQIFLGPRFPGIGGTFPLTQQELAQAMPYPELVFLGRFPSPHQIAQRFVLGIGHPHRGQFAGAITTRQLLGIAAVGFHPVAGSGRHQRRRDHLTRHAQLGELPVQHLVLLCYKSRKQAVKVAGDLL